MKIAFHTNQLCLRGTTSAVFNYATNNITLLNNESCIIYEKNNGYNNKGMIDFFKNRFDVFAYNNFSEVDDYLKSQKADVLYMIKGGWIDNKTTNVCKNCVHAVFNHYEPHGNVYAYISEWLSNLATQGKSPFVPPIIDMETTTDNLRSLLGIPEDAIVFGRHGGEGTFDIPFVHSAIVDTVNTNKANNIYFLFLNTNAFSSHKHIIYLPPIQNQNMVLKSAFINTCDAMIHARKDGETFSSAIAEFLFHNKPVIAFKGGTDTEHIHRLGNKGIFYTNYNDCLNIFKNFDKSIHKSINYKELVDPYKKENVMQKFKEVFLK